MPSSDLRVLARPRLAGRPGDDRERMLGGGRHDQLAGRDLEARLARRLPRRRRRGPGRAASGSSSGARVGRPIPKPGIAALPHASSGVAARIPACAGLGEVHRHLRVVEGQGRVVAVGGRRVVEVAEGERRARRS